MTQQLSRPPDQPQQQNAQPAFKHGQTLTRRWVILMLVLISIILLGFAALVIRNIPLLIAQSTVPPAPYNPLQVPLQDQATPSTLTLAGNQYVIFEQGNAIYAVSALDGVHRQLAATGYIYNRSTPPRLLPGGKLLYSGDGVWMIDLFNDNPRQIAPLPLGQVITSLVLSADGTQVAWSTAPQNGTGVIRIYTTSLKQPGGTKLVYQQSAMRCPCFRVFSFLPGQGQQGTSALLLTDDKGDHNLVTYGLWSLNLMAPPSSALRQLLNETGLQMPLDLLPEKNLLLYTTRGGFVPMPDDFSAPGDIAALTYPNSLSFALVQGGESATSSLSAKRLILPPQRQLNDSSNYHWVLTPRFSPDGHTLVYIVFSSNAQYPFIRRSSLYSVQFSAGGTTLQSGKPIVLATASSRYIELGAWLNDHVLTFYSDGFLYAFDTSSGAVTTITHTGDYAHVIAVVQHG